MSLPEQLERVAAAAAPFGAVGAVLPAEIASGARAFLIALGENEALEWLVLDDRFEPVVELEQVSDIASIVVLCELAVELSVSGCLEELHTRLAQAGPAEPDALSARAREAAAELELVIGAPPRVASLAYLDRIAAAAQRLERALGDHASPLASALGSHAGTVEAFIAEVGDRHRMPLR